MSGIGKTTIAKYIQGKIGAKFDGTAFLQDVKGASEQEHGFLGLQKKLICESLKIKDIFITNTNVGVGEIRRILHDNVDHAAQVDSLAKERSWFGPGSRIVITCRDEDVLNQIKVDHIHKVRHLSDEDSLHLFSWHAFGEKQPFEGYMDLSKDLVHNVARGLPLALEVIGRTLRSKQDKAEWVSMLEKLKSIPHEDIINKLRQCFDSLKEIEKNCVS